METYREIVRPYLNLRLPTGSGEHQIANFDEDEEWVFSKAVCFAVIKKTTSGKKTFEKI